MDPSTCQKIVFTKNLDFLSEIRQIQNSPIQPQKCGFLAAEFSYVFAAESSYISSEGVPSG